MADTDGSRAVSAALILGAYLLGAVPFGLLFARVLRGVDPRRHGSGNIGATNVARSAGRAIGALTLLFDVSKGGLFAWLALRLGLPLAVAALAGLFAVLGHVFPIYLGFRGGKGVATGAGVFLALSPICAAAALLVFLVTCAATRLVSLGSLLATSALMIAVLTLDRRPEVVGLAAAVALLVTFAHRRNIGRLLHREEPRI